MENKIIKILAIDDNLDNLITIQALISDNLPLSQVIIALSGKEGLALASVEDPDVILLDIVMPEMDGYEVCRQLKENNNLIDIPVVFLTSLKGDKASRIKGLECGAEAFLAKPIDEGELISQIRAMVKIKVANNNKKDETKRLAHLVLERTKELSETHLATLNLLEDLRAENEARRKTAEALKASEALYRSILDASPDAIVLSDLLGRIQMVSPNGLKLMGFEKESFLVGKYLGEFLAKDDVERAMKNIESMFLGVFNGPEEYQLINSDNQLASVEINAQFVMDENGEPFRFVFAIRDISERKKAELALIESEEKYRFMTENISDVIWHMDSHFCFDYVSPAIERMQGYKPEELMGQPMFSLLNEDGVKHIEDEVATIRERLKTNTLKPEMKFEYQSLCKDGSWIWVEVNVTIQLDENNLPVGFHGITRDITARKKFEDALRESESRYNTFINNNADMIFVKDNQMRYLVANNAMAEFYDKSPEEMLNKTDKELADNSLNYPCISSDQNVLQKNTTIVIEEKLGDRVFETTKFPMKLGDNTSGIGGILHDITERKLAEAKLNYVTRLYALLSHVNQAIIQIKNIDELFDTICKMTVEYGKFRMCWIGIYDENEQCIEPKTFAGYNEGYLDNLNICPYDKLTGFGPTGTAFREQRIVFCNDIENDLIMLPWKDEALKREYRSSFSTPIFRNKKPYGTLTFYAKEVDFFNEDERKLLQEVSRNISFAIEAIDAESEKKSSLRALENSRHELKIIYDNAPVMMCVVNEKREIQFANKAFKELTGFREELEINGVLGGVVGCIHSYESENGCGYGQNCANCTLRRAIEVTFLTGIGISNIEYHSTIQKKEEIYLLGSTASIDTNDTKNILLCLHNITNRKMVEEALQKSEVLLRTFIDNSPFEIWARDNESIGILENKMFVNNCGSIIGLKPNSDNRVDSNTINRWEQVNGRVFSGEIVDEEFEFDVKGQRRNFQQIVFPIKTPTQTIGIAGFNIDITERKLDEKALNESREQLKKFAAHLQNVREEERNLLARDIHDDLGQILIAMKIDLGLLKQGLVKNLEGKILEDSMQKFNDLQNLVDNTLKSARRIMTDLRPEVLDLLGLIETINQHIKSFAERNKIECKLINHTNNLELNSQHSVALFRIVQEALNNIAKHARATKVEVRLTEAKDKFTLEIKDNGIGFDTNDKRKIDSYGLLGMKERVFLLGGKLKITSQKDKGTTIKVEI